MIRIFSRPCVRLLLLDGVDLLEMAEDSLVSNCRISQGCLHSRARVAEKGD